MFEIRIGLAKNGSWAYAVHEFLTGRCIATAAGFGSAQFAHEAADDAMRRLSV